MLISPAKGVYSNVMMIDGSTRVEELIAAKPGAVRVLIEMGSPCLVCGEPFWGTLRDLATKHKVDLETILSRLRDMEEDS